MLHRLKQLKKFTLLLLDSIKEQNDSKQNVKTNRNIMKALDITLIQRLYFKVMQPMQSAKSYEKYIQIRTKHL